MSKVYSFLRVSSCPSWKKKKEKRHVLSFAENIPKPLRIVAAGAILVVGGSLTFLILFLGVRSIGSDFIRVEAAGETEIALPRAGAYTVFHEYKSEVDGRVLRSEKRFKPVDCVLERSEDDVAISLSEKFGNSNYSIGKYAGYSIGKFQVPEAGTYRLSVRYRDGISEPRTVLALTQGFGTRLTAGILMIVAIVLATVFAVIFLILGRIPNKKRMKEVRDAR